MKPVQLLVALFGLSCVVGCKTGPIADPNDPKEAGLLAPEVIRRQLRGTSDMLMERVDKGEITNDEFKALIAKRANELLDDLPMNKIDPSRAWEYGEVFRTAQKWPQAKQTLQIAVDYAIKTNNEDRRINDLLRLAHCEAKLGEIDEAIKTAGRAMDATPTGSAPILPAVLLEIVPAAQGQKHDPQLATLLKTAIDKEMKTIVDASMDAGKAFLYARPHHVHSAWDKVIELYSKAGMTAEARTAVADKEKMMNVFHPV